LEPIISVSDTKTRFERLVALCAGNDAAAWLAATAGGLGRDGLERLCGAYTAAAVRVGRMPVAPTVAAHPDLAPASPAPTLERWTADDAARAVLLLSAAEAMSSDGFVDAATACYERGDSREQQSWLRALALLPDAGRFLGLAIDACRTNIVPLFEAIACENPYPARFFPERNFNQMVLKALFNSIALARIVGLPSRLNAELSRMAGDYAAERRAAGRTVPADIGMAMHQSTSLQS
jgi:hypothetical protein